ncbi:MAG TPA: DUF3592 domain-containing protein [Pyrinomonadaceae bacterium]|jgi:Protein of unknown function (DUF3592).|nr:DUF3592 domain-containing protein [Pyrinomonadaceae bacterium]
MENLIAGIFALLIGGVGLWTGFMQLRNRAAFSHWKTTPGKVIERGTCQPSNAMFGAGAFRYAPLVKYSYEVGGRQFVNNSIFPVRIQLPQRNTQKWAQRKAEGFPNEVVVYYNPVDANESYLVLTSRWTLYAVLAASCVVVMMGLLFLLLFAQ